MSNTLISVTVEQFFKTSIDKVWDALTQLDQMKQWFFENIESFKPQVGFKTQFNVRVEDKNFLHLWKLTEVLPERKITYNWSYGNYSGSSLVSFELSEQEGQTKLRLTHRETAPFPRDVPEFSKESCTAGWHYFIKNRLKSFLEK